MDQFASDIVLTDGIDQNQESDENNLNNPLAGKNCSYYYRVNPIICCLTTIPLDPQLA